jgi:hypothetical protein
MDIDQLRRISLVLASGDLPAEERDAILASLPVELREDFRSIGGRHRRYGRRRSLSREDVKELVTGFDTLRETLSRKPDSDTWTRDEWAARDHVVELRFAAYGPSTARKIEEIGKARKIADALATADVVVMEGPATPTYVRGLPKRLDEWGAKRHGVTLATFRSWRTKLRKDGWLSTPPPRGRAKRVRDN